MRKLGQIAQLRGAAVKKFWSWIAEYCYQVEITYKKYQGPGELFQVIVQWLSVGQNEAYENVYLLELYRGLVSFASHIVEMTQFLCLT